MLVSLLFCYTKHMILGIDEAGRGCWAGPLVAGAVMLQRPIVGLKDSKQLSRQQREMLYDLIQANAFVGIGWASAQEVDDLGLTAATRLAMQRAVEQIREPCNEIIIDGNINYLPERAKVKTLVKADSLIAEVSAASIIAKVTRDRYMEQTAVTHPHYGFEKHVGYGTKLHLEKLKEHGICELHRLSYKPLQALLGVTNV